MFIYPNMTFVTHGFLRQKENKKLYINNAFGKDPYYSLTDEARYFYNNIFKEPNQSKDNNVPSTTSFNYRRF